MHSRLWKTIIATLLAAVELFAGVAVAGISPAGGTAGGGTESAQPSCEMVCCKVSRCWCEAAPAKTPAPAVPLVQPLEYKLTPPLPSTDLLSAAVLEALKEPKAPAPSTEATAHAPEAPLFALHCSWLI